MLGLYFFLVLLPHKSFDNRILIASFHDTFADTLSLKKNKSIEITRNIEENANRDERNFKIIKTPFAVKKKKVRKTFLLTSNTDESYRDTLSDTEQLSYKIKEDDASRPCYAWGKVRDQDCLILFDPGSNCNFISQELASKLGIHAHEMGLAIEADGAFDTPAVPVTPLIGKLHIHVEGYVD